MIVPDQGSEAGLSPAEAARGGSRTSGRLTPLLEAALLGLLALVARLIALDHAPYVDELNHVLAARSLLEDGTMRITGGAVYERAALFTRLVAEMFRLFGESLVVARVPAVVGGVALVLLLFLWVRSFAGRLAAWLAGLLLCFSPGAIYLSQQCRFYSVHAALFLGGAIALLALLARPRPGGRTIGLGLLSAVLFLLAWHLQVLTLIGLGGVFLWCAFAISPSLGRRLRGGPRAARIGVPLAALAILVVAVPSLSGQARAFWRFFHRFDLWAAADSGNFRYYHWLFLEQYATLWTLFPLLALLALRSRGRETTFSLFVFTTAFLVQSLAAWKSERYLFYAMPFFFAVAGTGLAAAIRWLLPSAEGLFSAAPFRRKARTARALGVALLLGIGLFALAGNGASSITARMLTGGDSDWPFARAYRGEPDWRAASERLRPLLTEGTVLIGSSDLKGIYYFGRLDYCISRDLIEETGGPAPEFHPHWKTGIPLVAEVSSIERIMAEHASGLVVVEKKQLRTKWGVSAAVVDYLEQRTEEIPLPPEWRLRAFRWPASTPAP
jgi:hypothetical protein